MAERKLEVVPRLQQLGEAAPVLRDSNSRTLTKSSGTTEGTFAPQNTLLGLPGELRNRIIRYTVVQDTCRPTDVHVLLKGRTDTKNFWKITPAEPALALARGKELRHQVLSIYYAENTFEITRASHHRHEAMMFRLQHWQAYLGPYATHLKQLLFTLRVDVEVPCAMKGTVILDEKFRTSGRMDEHGKLAAKRMCLGVSNVPHYPERVRMEAYCSCDLEAWAAATGPEATGPKESGGHRLFELVEHCAREIDNLHESGKCDKCSRPQLQRKAVVEAADDH